MAKAVPFLHLTQLTNYVETMYNKFYTSETMAVSRMYI